MASIHPILQGTIFDVTQGKIRADNEENPLAALDESTLITFYSFPNPDRKVFSMQELEENDIDPFVWLGLRIAGEIKGGTTVPNQVILATEIDDGVAYSVSGNPFAPESVVVVVSGPLVRWWHLSLDQTDPLLNTDKTKIDIQLGTMDEPTVYQLKLEKIKEGESFKYTFHSFFITINNAGVPLIIYDENAPDTTFEEVIEKFA